MKKKIAVALATGAGVTAAALGGAGLAFADPTATPTDSPSASASPTGSPSQGKSQRDGRGGHGMDTATLAQKLGVDEETLKTALQEIRQADRNGQENRDNSTKPDPSTRQAELAKQLAEKLGIDEAKVTAALTEMEQSEQAGRRDQLKSRLDQGVTDGKISQADADAVLKAFDAGVLGGR